MRLGFRRIQGQWLLHTAAQHEDICGGSNFAIYKRPSSYILALLVLVVVTCLRGLLVLELNPPKESTSGTNYEQTPGMSTEDLSSRQHHVFAPASFLSRANPVTSIIRTVHNTLPAMRHLQRRPEEGEEVYSKHMLNSDWWEHSSDRVDQKQAHVDTLVLYVVSFTDDANYDNLKFYIRAGMHEGDGCHHIIVIKSNPGSPRVVVPDLPPNAKYIYHEEECYNWGSLGWALQHEIVQIRDYKYFIFLNSGARGPFLPPYLQGKVHFSDLMTDMLQRSDRRGSVKLVGSSINCHGAIRISGGSRRSNPYLQSHALATDHTGLQLMIDDGDIFKCHDSTDQAVFHSEMGSTYAILQAGYNIASLMTRYQGVNWLDHDNWMCNDKENPTKWAAVDIYSLQPMELMFIKVQASGLKNEYPSMLEAVQYDLWSAASEKGDVNVSKHLFKEKEWASKAERVLKMAARGPECWDCEFYQAENEDTQDMSCYEAFSHFVNHGQFDMDRPFRFTCDTSWKMHGVPFDFNSKNGTKEWPAIKADKCKPGRPQYAKRRYHRAAVNTTHTANGTQVTRNSTNSSDHSITSSIPNYIAQLNISTLALDMFEDDWSGEEVDIDYF